MNQFAGKTIFWRNDKVEVLDCLTSTDDFKHSSMFKYLYCPCAWVSNARGTICGFYDQSERFDIGWQPGKIEKFPKKFRLALLIMGVT
jgi:hypothetical protein